MTDAEAGILWPGDMKNLLIRKDPDAGKDWRQEKKGTTEDEMVGWHYWLDAHESEQTQGVGDGQGSLVCYSPWGCKESDMAEWLNWTELEFSNLNLHARCVVVCVCVCVCVCMPCLWLRGSQSTVENSERDGNTRPPDLPLEKPICRSGSNS